MLSKNIFFQKNPVWCGDGCVWRELKGKIPDRAVTIIQYDGRQVFIGRLRHKVKHKVKRTVKRTKEFANKLDVEFVEKIVDEFIYRPVFNYDMHKGSSTFNYLDDWAPYGRILRKKEFEILVYGENATNRKCDQPSLIE